MVSIIKSGQTNVKIMNVIVYSLSAWPWPLTRCRLTLRDCDPQGDAARDKIKLCFNNQAARLIYTLYTEQVVITCCSLCPFKPVMTKTKGWLRLTSKTHEPSMRAEA